MGVAEQNMATVAAGMALAGKIPFISSYAMFSPGRNWEQIRTTICYNDVPVKIAGAHAGISVGPDGATHQALEDIAIMRALPNMTVFVPCDAIEAKKATVAAARDRGPCYLRFAREKTPVITTEETPFTAGKAEVFRDGDDAAIIACGPMVYEALVAAAQLEKEGLNVAVLNCHTIKPIDEKTILDYANKCRAIVTAEEHQSHSGLGGAVCELLAATNPVPIVRVGVHDQFGESGPPEDLLVKFNLKAVDIVAAVRTTIALKSQASPQVCPPQMPEPLSSELRLPSQLFTDVRPEHVFHVANGSTLRNIADLHQALLTMDDASLRHHVNESKNDFAAWVKDVHRDEKLSTLLAKARTRSELAACIMQRIAGR